MKAFLASGQVFVVNGDSVELVESHFINNKLKRTARDEELNSWKSTQIEAGG